MFVTTSAQISKALAATHARAIATGRVWSSEEFAALLAAPGALLSGDATSFVLGRVIADEAEVLMVATDPAQQRRGLARAALAAFCDTARARGAASVFLEVAATNTPAIALYSAANFAVQGTRRGYYRQADGTTVDALLLRRDLTSG